MDDVMIVTFQMRPPRFSLRFGFQQQLEFAHVEAGTSDEEGRQ
jgi:hypothetical protein